jgi:hypothetical protein
MVFAVRPVLPACRHWPVVPNALIPATPTPDNRSATIEIIIVFEWIIFFMSRVLTLRVINPGFSTVREGEKSEDSSAAATQGARFRTHAGDCDVP